MGALKTDDFNRADGGLGANWSNTGFSQMTISSNAVHKVGSGSFAQRYTESGAFVAPVDQYAKCVISNLPSSDNRPGVICRASGASDFYQGTGSALDSKMHKCVGGTFTELGAGPAFSDGDTIELRVIGTSISVLKNGSVVIGPVTDTDIVSGDAGIWMFIDSAADPTIDDFEVGMVGPTILDLAFGTSTTSNTTVVTNSAVTADVGDWLVVVAASSNDGASGAASMTTVVDSDGVNTYTQRALINYDPGAAGAGATLGFYTCQVTSALSGDTITVNHSGNTDQKAVQVYRVIPAPGTTISFLSADTTGSTGNASSYTAATVSVTNGDVIFGAAAIETDDAVTGDTDTTNGSWSPIITRLADGGADAATMSSCSQFKTVSATGDQNWACSTSTARDSARTYLILHPISGDTQEWRGSYPPWRLSGPNNVMYYQNI